jgi:chromosome segregation ATPase
MSEQHEKLKATIRQLEQELHSVEAVDGDTRAALGEVLQEIHSVLSKRNPSESESQSMANRLSQAANEFEGAHPTLAGTIQRLIDGLGQMGI